MDNATLAAAAALAKAQAYDGIANLTNKSLPNWRGALADMKAGTRDAVIQMIGDSTTAGAFATTSNTTYIGAKANSYPTRMSAEFNRLGLVSTCATYLGDGGAAASATLPQYTPDVTAASGWATTTGQSPRPPGGCPQANTTTTGNLTFAPPAAAGSFNTADIYYLQDTTYGSFTYQADSGSLTTVNAAGSRSVQKVTLALGSAGTHVVNIARVSGTILICGVEFYNTAKSVIRVRNIGVGSSLSADGASTSQPWAPGVVNGTLFTADLSIIGYGINDAVQGVAPATTLANLIAAGTAVLRGGGDLLFMKPLPSNVGSASAVVQAALNTAIDTAAANFGAPVISMPWRVTDQATAIAQGFALTQDALHYLPRCYTDQAAWFVKTLLR